jgi:hypothetical protein
VRLIDFCSISFEELRRDAASFANGTVIEAENKEEITDKKTKINAQIIVSSIGRVLNLN